MKIYVEQIVVRDAVLIYSNYAKFTDSSDEEGADYEYDFESLYANTDGIFATVIRLYGTTGILKLLQKFAEGSSFDMDFESVEFEEGSELKTLIAKSIGEATVKHIEQTHEPLIQIEQIEKRKLIPSDSIFLLNGMFDALPLNEDLNVMKMMGDVHSDADSSLVQDCISYIADTGFKSNGLSAGKSFTFDMGGASKTVLVGRSGFYGFTQVNDQLILDFPDNQQQEKMHLLFDKYIDIIGVTKLKTKLLFEIRFNALAQSESSKALPDLYVLFDVLNEKFIAKEKRLII
ncbi:MAG: hypothetical protein ACI9N1_002518 [Flavobacteriales bacterium]|jgi:hypothetical protein